jgi:hypothetical protein
MNPAYASAFAFGRQLAALVTRDGAQLAPGLEATGYRVAVLTGRRSDPAFPRSLAILREIS